jgi:hypothetical protein
MNRVSIDDIASFTEREDGITEANIVLLIKPQYAEEILMSGIRHLKEGKDPKDFEKENAEIVEHFKQSRGKCYRELNETMARILLFEVASYLGDHYASSVQQPDQEKLTTLNRMQLQLAQNEPHGNIYYDTIREFLSQFPLRTVSVGGRKGAHYVTNLMDIVDEIKVPTFDITLGGRKFNYRLHSQGWLFGTYNDFSDQTEYEVFRNVHRVFASPVSACLDVLTYNGPNHIISILDSMKPDGIMLAPSEVKFRGQDTLDFFGYASRLPKEK